MGVGGGGDVGQRAKRQAVAHGAVTRHKVQVTAAQFPFFGLPAGGGARLPALHGQHEARGFGEAPGEGAGDTGTLFRVLQLGIFRGDVFGQVPLFQYPFRRILEGGGNVIGRHAEFDRDGLQQSFGFGGGGGIIAAFGGDQGGVGPDRFAVTPPIQAEGPAGQGFPGVPFALTIMQEAAGCEFGL